MCGTRLQGKGCACLSEGRVERKHDDLVQWKENTNKGNARIIEEGRVVDLSLRCVTLPVSWTDTLELEMLSATRPVVTDAPKRPTQYMPVSIHATVRMRPLNVTGATSP